MNKHPWRRRLSREAAAAVLKTLLPILSKRKARGDEAMRRAAAGEKGGRGRESVLVCLAALRGPACFISSCAGGKGPRGEEGTGG